MMNTFTPCIQLQNVCFRYAEESVSVLNHVNLSIYPQCINLILGDSGCGKSTLLYLLNGLIPEFYEGSVEGSILFENSDLLAQPLHERAKHFGFVFQNPESQFCTFTVEDEIAFGLENQGQSPERIDAEIQHVLSLVGMEQARHKRLGELSGGEKQKIAIASVLALKPPILLLDEPTANLDAASRAEIFRLLETLVSVHKKTIVIIEHNVGCLLPLAQHLIVFHSNGSVALQGKRDDVLRQLLYNPDFQEVSPQLPQKYQISKNWLKHCSHYAQIAAYRKEKLAGNGPVFSESELVALWRELRSPTSGSPRSHSTDPTTKLLQAQHLAYRYPAKSEQPLLKDVSFSIQQGDFVALLGANGAGKSTLLKLLFKALAPYQGSLTLQSKEVSSWPDELLYQQMGLVFQNPEHQFVANTVAQELMYSLKNAPLSLTEKEALVQRYLETFSLQPHAHKSPFVLSQGQKRRLSVAVMLITGQNILFLDEPDYGQDYTNQLNLMRELKALNQSGITVVMITHNMSLVADYANKILVLENGVVHSLSSPNVLFQNKDLVQQTSLEEPEALLFSQILHGLCDEIPIVASGKALQDFLIQTTAESDN